MRRDGRRQGAPWGLFYKGTDPNHEGPTLMASSPSEAPPLNIIILRVRENTSFCLYGSYSLLVLSLTAKGITVGDLDLYVASLSLSSSSLRRDNTP